MHGGMVRLGAVGVKWLGGARVGGGLKQGAPERSWGAAARGKGVLERCLSTPLRPLRARVGSGNTATCGRHMTKGQRAMAVAGVVSVSDTPITRALRD
jgi:hypothetical protein